MGDPSQFKNIPQELRAARRWVLWSLCDVTADGKVRKACKIPFTIEGKPADHSDPKTWSTFDEILAAHARNQVLTPPANSVFSADPKRGIGMVLGPPFIGCDLDKCRVDGVISAEAQRWIAELNSYTELSQSGTGVHIILHGEPPYKQGHRKDDREVYSSNRFFVMTGDVLEGHEEIRRFTPAEVKALYERVKAGRSADRSSAHSSVAESATHPSYTAAKIADVLNRTDHADLSQAVQSALTMLMIEHTLDAKKVEAAFLESKLCNETHWKEKWARLREDELALAMKNARENIAKRLTRGKPEEAPHAPLVISTAGQLLTKTYKKREPLMVTQVNGHPVFHTSSINQVHAFRGVGKTAFEMGKCGALVAAGDFLQWRATREFRVLYVEGELPGEEMQDRVRSLVGESENFAVITPEDQPDARIPSIITAEGQRLIEEALVAHRAEVLVLDSISTLANIATNDEANWLILCDWFRLLRNKYGVALFFLMHDGKTGLQRGHSKSEDLPDKSVQLFWENGYKGQDGLKFALTFDKARQPVKEAHSLSVELIEENGRSVWVSTVRDSSGDSQKAIAFAMFDKKITSEKVRETLKVAQGTVTEWKKEWKAAKKSDQSEMQIEEQPATDDGAPGY